MEFKNLGLKERKLLLLALDFEEVNSDGILTCQFCGEDIHYSKCGIMPSTRKGVDATILCESILCMAEYLGKMENIKNEN